MGEESGLKELTGYGNKQIKTSKYTGIINLHSEV
jgi:hypothetical protein